MLDHPETRPGFRILSRDKLGSSREAVSNACFFARQESPLILSIRLDQQNADVTMCTSDWEDAVGVADKALYTAQDTFTCKESGEIFPVAKINDDFCDCADGTDEPGMCGCKQASSFSSGSCVGCCAIDKRMRMQHRICEDAEK